MWMVALCCLPISSQLCSSVFSGDESTFNQLVKVHVNVRSVITYLYNDLSPENMIKW